MFNFEAGIKELIVVRHGESQYNAELTDHLDSELTKKGIEQAHVTGKFIKEHFNHINNFVGITSPYIRCLQTSNIIQEETGIEFVVDSGPREIMTIYQDVEVKNKQHEFPHFTWKHHDDLFFTQETDLQFATRIKKFHDDLTDEKLLIVSHGTPVNMFYQLSTGVGPTIDIINYVKNCAISYIRDGEGIWCGKVVYAEND